MSKLNDKIKTELSYATSEYWLPPTHLSLLLTFKCNFRCATCSVWRKANFQELPDLDWLAVADDLKRSLPATTFVEINGGEALLEPNKVLTLIARLSGYFSNITLNTNGSLLTQEIIDRLTDSGLSAAKLSLYSLEDKTHDELRGFPGAYTRARNALKLLTESPLKTEVGLLVTGKNIKHLPKLITYLNGLPQTTAILQALDESVESFESKDLTDNKLLTALWPEADEVENFFTWLSVAHPERRVKNSPANLKAIKNYYLKPDSALNYRCFAGQKNLTIYPSGEVAMCFKGPVLGQLPTEPLLKILTSQRAKKIRRSFKTCPKYCRVVGCNFQPGFKEIIKEKI